MKRKKIQKKQHKKPFYKGMPKLSSEQCLGIFLATGVIVASLLFASCLRVSNAKIALPSVRAPHTALENNVRGVVSGYPIEAMTPYIAKQNKMTAAFLVAIGKKESNWGKRVPLDKDGADCFNYWGYRGAGSRGIAMGHGCFGSRKEAIETVSKRIDTLVNDYKLDTPEELVVWKCGWSCSGHNEKSVKKWISEVALYFNKVYN
jgi:hypothetical protein